jgi:hypothetical protein
MQTRAKVQNKNKNCGSVSRSNDYNSQKCAYIISGEGYIEWNDFTSDTLYTTTTTPTKERNIEAHPSQRRESVWRAGTPYFLSRRENNGTTSVYRMGRVCIRRLVPPPRYTYTADLSNCVRDSTETGWRSRMNEWTGPKNIQKNTCPDVLDNSMDHRI